VRLERCLQELISVLERASLPGPEVLASSFARVEEALEEARGDGGLDGAQGERCRRLHAVACELATRRREELGARRQACASWRARIGEVREGLGGGGSCDLAA